MSFRQLQDAIADALLDNDTADCRECQATGEDGNGAPCPYCDGSGQWPAVEL